MRVAFRVDASRAIGLGHVQRCLALAYALRELGVGVVFITRRLDVDTMSRITAAGFPAHLLSTPAADAMIDDMPVHSAWAGVSWTVDVDETIAALAAEAPDWLVVDHYAFDARWHRALASALKARMAVIDDLADRELHADLLIDHNLAEPDHRSKYRGRLADSTLLLGGPRYALLGPAYVDAPRCSPGNVVRSIGIFMGGADAANLSEASLRACREVAAFDGEVELVTTLANPARSRLEALAGGWPRTRTTVDLPDLAAFFARHDLQIGAGGGATWERCCVGAPALALVAADNQRAVIPALARLGAVATLAGNKTPTAASIGQALSDLLANPGQLQSLSERARSLVDGRGAQRVALRLAGTTMCMRRASMSDCQMLHRWRNDPATRAVSRKTETIAVDEHKRWLARTLADKTRTLLIGQVGRLDVGAIRLDKRDDGNVEVSLYLDPQLHRLGLGATLLRAGENWLDTHDSNGHRFVATVLADNASSRRLFESTGYRFVHDRWEKPTRPAPSLDISHTAP